MILDILFEHSSILNAFCIFLSINAFSILTLYILVQNYIYTLVLSFLKACIVCITKQLYHLIYFLKKMVTIEEVLTEPYL